MSSMTFDRLSETHTMTLPVTRWGDHAPQWGDTRTCPGLSMQEGGRLLQLDVVIEPGTVEQQITRQHPVTVTCASTVIARGHATASGVVLAPRGGRGRWTGRELHGLARIIERAAHQVGIPIHTA